MPIKDIIGGDTIKFTFISSGDSFSPISCQILTGSETVIASSTMTSSGNGHYYYNHVSVTTPGYYLGKMVAYINSLSYVRHEWFRVRPMEVS